jgi:hypothetical protein
MSLFFPYKNKTDFYSGPKIARRFQRVPCRCFLDKNFEWGLQLADLRTDQQSAWCKVAHKARFVQALSSATVNGPMYSHIVNVGDQIAVTDHIADCVLSQPRFLKYVRAYCIIPFGRYCSAFARCGV